MAVNEALKQPLVEFGATGLKQFSGYVREEFLRDLTGWRGVRAFREMRDNDPVVGAMFFAVERLLLGVSFSFEPISNAPDDIEAANFLDSCATDMEQTWPEILSEALTFLQYGWSVQEIVYKRRRGATNDPQTRSKYDDGMLGWRKFAGRAQESLLHWEFDESGDPVAMIQLLPTGGSLLRVPLAKSLHFRTRLLKNNPEGVSLMRNAYIPWFRKKRIEEIEAIGIERDLAGLPIAWVPARITSEDATAADKAQMESFKKMVRDTVRNEQEGFVLPLVYDKDGHKLYDFTLLTTGGRRQIDTSVIVDRYDHRIASTWLADFLMLGQGASGRSQGTGAQSKNKTDMFKVTVVSILDMIVAEINRKAVPDLLTLNSMSGAAQLKRGEINSRDVKQFADALLAASQAMLITPDANTEAAVRDELGLPAQLGVQTDDITTGGATEGAEVDTTGSETSSSALDAGQGQGAGARADDLAQPAGAYGQGKTAKRAPARKRRR